MIVEIAAFAAAGCMFLRGLYHSGVLSGWIAQVFRDNEIRAVVAPPTPAKPKFDVVAHERALFHAVPLAFWLDPYLWGEPPSIDRFTSSQGVRSAVYGEAQIKGTPVYHEPDKLPDVEPCPVCGRAGHAYIKITAQHGDEATMMECERCGCEFTKAGETKKSKLWRNRKKLGPQLDDALLRPPGMAVLNPRATYKIETDLPARPLLPCGCLDAGITHTKGSWGSMVRCSRCEKWWEPPSNGGPRELAQGEHVHDRDDMTPQAEARWDDVVKYGLENHGACPSYECRFPVAKRHGLYYCTNTSCRHHDRGWK